MITTPIINILADIQLNDTEKLFCFFLLYFFILGTGMSCLIRLLYIRRHNKNEKTKK